MPIETLKHSVVGLAKAARVMDIPIVAATTGRDFLWGPLRGFEGSFAVAQSRSKSR
jgi:hypothetical protein